MRLRIALAIVLIALTSAGAHPQAAQAQITRPYSLDGSELVGPGVNYEFGSLDLAKGGRQNVNIVELDPADARTHLRVSQTDGVAVHRRVVAEQDAAYSQSGQRVVASINGSLFSYMRSAVENNAGGVLLGAGLGINVSDGELINAGDPAGRATPVPAFGVGADGSVQIGEPHVEVGLTLSGGSTVAIDRINQERFDGDMVLYTPRWDTHTWTNGLGTEYVIDGFDLPLATTGTYSGMVVAISDGVGDTHLGADQVVLSVSSTAAPLPVALTVGSEVAVDIGISAEWASAMQIVSGRDMLVTSGTSVVPQPDTDGRHARTAVGITASGRVLMVVADSGSFLYGVTLTDLAQLLLSLGAVSAMNLDGGVSSQMTVRLPGDIGTSAVTTIAKPTDRPVVNSLQVVSEATDGPLSSLLVSPRDALATTGERVEFVAKGQDADLNGVAVDPANVDWNVERVGGGASPLVETTESGIAVRSDVQGDFVVTSQVGDLGAEAQLTVGHDTSAPVVSTLSAAISNAGTAGKTSAVVQFGWSAVDNGTLESVEVQRKIGSGSWSTVHSSPTATTAQVTVDYGKKVTFRVRASDTAGNTSAWVTSKVFRLDLVDDKSQQIGKSGTWKRKKSSDAIGSKYARSQSTGAATSLTAFALQVALVSNRGPSHGVADIALNGIPEDSVNLVAGSTQSRKIVFISSPATSESETTIEVRNAGTAQRPFVDLDAFLVLVVVD